MEEHICETKMGAVSFCASCLQINLAASEAQRVRLVEAVKFYADRKNWMIVYQEGYGTFKSNVDIDDGEQARKALGEGVGE